MLDLLAGGGVADQSVRHVGVDGASVEKLFDSLSDAVGIRAAEGRGSIEQDAGLRERAGDFGIGDPGKIIEDDGGGGSVDYVIGDTHAARDAGEFVVHRVEQAERGELVGAGLQRVAIHDHAGFHADGGGDLIGFEAGRAGDGDGIEPGGSGFGGLPRCMCSKRGEKKQENSYQSGERD